MIVPRYWAEGRVRSRAGGRQVTVRRFGWSNESQAAAQRHADERAAAALATILGGKEAERREPKVPYNGAEGVPIREEILAEHGPVVLTRNSYGAVCLNTPDVLFADIDRVRLRGVFRYSIVATIAALWVLLPLAGMPRLLAAILPLVLGWLPGVMIGSLASRLVIAMHGGQERYARRRVAAFVRSSPHWHLRLYRTPAGLRLLAMHATFAADADEVAAFFARIGVDPTYAKMCRRQQCFRARLTAKPWRIGIAAHLRPGRGVWPVVPERMHLRAQWVADYTQKANAYAACRYLESLGSDAVDPRCEFVRVLHDDLARAASDLPLA